MVAGRGSARQSTGQRLKGNVVLGKKAVLRQYENLTVNLLTEFYLDESDHVQECRKLMNSIDTIIQMAKKKWGQG
jgi:hypothetical protein